MALRRPADELLIEDVLAVQHDVAPLGLTCAIA